MADSRGADTATSMGRFQSPLCIQVGCECMLTSNRVHACARVVCVCTSLPAVLVVERRWGSRQSPFSCCIHEPWRLVPNHQTHAAILNLKAAIMETFDILERCSSGILNRVLESSSCVSAQVELCLLLLLLLCVCVRSPPLFGQCLHKQNETQILVLRA